MRPGWLDSFQAGGGVKHAGGDKPKQHPVQLGSVLGWADETSDIDDEIDILAPFELEHGMWIQARGVGYSTDHWHVRP